MYPGQQALPAFPATVYNHSYATYPYSGSGLQGPFYDNDFGTPPGNCRAKYGAAPDSAAALAAGTTPFTSASVYGYTNGNVNQSMNIWDGNLAHAPGPYGGNASPGYYYATGGTPGSGNNDGLRYFYDPYSMPSVNTNTAFTAFTDLVANISAVTAGSYPISQPLYGPTTFANAHALLFACDL